MINTEIQISRTSECTPNLDRRCQKKTVGGNKNRNVKMKYVVKKVGLLHICMLICGSIKVVNVICWILQHGGRRVNGKPTLGEWELSVNATS